MELPERDEPFKMSVGAGLPDTDQERVDDWPELMEAGDAKKEEIVGTVWTGGVIEEGTKATAP